VFRIASDTHREFGRLLNIVEAAELLDFVDTPKRMVVLDAVGKRYVKALPEERKAIWREQLLKLRLFRDVYTALQRQPDHTVDQDFVLETIVLNMPHENYEAVFQTFLRWARFGNLFAYDEATQTISLHESQGEPVA
jgi:NitT/TauT family transport system ATP-binding protein